MYSSTDFRAVFDQLNWMNDPSNRNTERMDFPTSEELARQRPMPRRKIKIPLILFLLTCLSTFWVGIYGWQPPSNPMELARMDLLLMRFRMMFLQNWEQGLWYMACLLLILLLHEFGHFFMTVYYRVPATVPIFLPFPLNPVGTLGAVIGMEGTLANRKQIFDIGIAGPLAGLLAAVPLAYIGVSELDLSAPPRGGIGFRLPLLMQWMVASANVPGYQASDPTVWINQMNPFFAAAWVGFLITGLNMMPVGQLDGGHVSYTLFGRKTSSRIAEATVILAIAFMVYVQQLVLVVMVLLILLIGTTHPPTSDDTVPIGPLRWVIGFGSLAIPILCFPPMVFKLVF